MKELQKQLKEKEEEIERLKTSIRSSERLRIQDAASAIDEANELREESRILENRLLSANSDIEKLRSAADALCQVQPKAAGQERETQEELWNEAQCDVKYALGTYSSDLVSDLARWAVEALKKKYTITRKP